MKGKRAAPARYSARRLAVREKRRKYRRDAVCAEEWAIIKLVVCGAVFVLIVALKLLFPQSVAEFGRSASALIETDADFVEAFAAIGRAASGEETVSDSLQDAYAAVFSPSSVGIAPEEKSPMPLMTEGSVPAAKKVSEIKNIDVEEGMTKKTDEESLETEAVSYVSALPENVSMEQRNLGFFCTTPVLGTLSSSFGWREHPVVGDLRFHYGLDLAAETGTEIYAFADGEVFATGESSTLGKYIILTHANGYRTLYGHCNSVLKLSGSVAVGEVIATVGDSGTATGPHLHFELQNGTLYLNPIYYVDIG